MWELLTHSMTFEKLMDCAPPANDKKNIDTKKFFSVRKIIDNELRENGN